MLFVDDQIRTLISAGEPLAAIIKKRIDGDDEGISERDYLRACKRLTAICDEIDAFERTRSGFSTSILPGQWRVRR